MASRLEGIAELTKKLSELGDPKASKRVLLGAVRVGMGRALKLARSNVPKGTVEHKTYKGRIVAPGYASRSLRVKTFIRKKDGAAVALLGVLPEAFYATQFIELGTAKMPAKEWLVPSFEQSQDAAIKAIGDTMRRRIDSIAAKRAAQNRSPPVAND